MAITLHQPPNRSWGSPNLSPFCTKLECYLRMRGLEYVVKPPSMQRAPRGKIPYVKLDDGSYLGDSQLIVAHLERTIPPGLDAALGERERAVGHFVRRTLEEATYFIGLHERWLPDDAYAETKAEFSKFIPPFIAPFVIPAIRRRMRTMLHGQGTGRFSRDDLVAIAARDFEAIAEVFGDGPFLFGERPSTFDAVLFAFVEAVLGFPVDGPVRRVVSDHAKLVAYRERMKATYFSDVRAG